MKNIVISNLLKRAGIKHGFSERGLSNDSPFGELNVKSDAGTPDDPNRAQRNRQYILKQAGADPEAAVFLRTLAHGNTVYEAHKQDIGHEIDGYDTIMTNQPLLAIGLSVADCLPILLYDPSHNAVAVVHAGWRGTKAGAASEAVKHMKRLYKTDPGELQAVIGPSICGPCYEVGDEVAELFDSDFITTHKDRQTLDIRAANLMQLKTSGVEKIDNIDLCTYENASRFYSVRKEGQTGRFLAFIQSK